MRLLISTLAYGLLFLAAIVAGNLIVNHYGPPATPYVAFALIGCDIVVRDRLHLNLAGAGRWLAIGSLIAIGSGITYLVNQDAGSIALASVSAFAAAMIVDTIVFALASPLDPHRRVNLSNAVAAAVDTVLFFAIAFHGLSAVPFLLIWSQWTAKVAGGWLWSLLLVREHDAEELYEPDAVLSRDA